MSHKVIIDTDPGIDDALALILALSAPELRVLAVTTVNGNVPVDTATRNAFTVFGLLPGIDAPPVARGAAAPLTGSRPVDVTPHGEDGLGALTNLTAADGRPLYPAAPGGPLPRPAVDVILGHIGRQPAGTVTLITLGPLTNVALALRRDAGIMRRLRRIVMMGGAVGVPGNVTPAAEFNVWVDPLAAAEVLAAGVPVTMVGLDVTRRTFLTPERVAAHRREHPGRLAAFLTDATRGWFRDAAARSGQARFNLHDPLAVAAVIWPELVDTHALHVAVDCAGGAADGMTVADRRPLVADRRPPPNVDVALGVKAAAVESRLLERLRS